MDLTQETVDLTAWTFREIGEMEVAAFGFIHGILKATPFSARKRITLKYTLSKTTSIHITNAHDESLILAFGHHIIWEDGEERRYSDEVYLCSVETYSVEFDKWGLNYPPSYHGPS